MADTDSDAGVFVGAYLNELMASLGLDRPQLSKLSGVSYSHLSNLVNDEKPLTAKVAIKLARPLGMDVAELLARHPVVPDTTGTVDAMGLVSMTHAKLHFIAAEADIPGLCHKGSLLRFKRTKDWIPGAWQLVEVAELSRVVRVSDDGKSLVTTYGEAITRSSLHRPVGELVEVRFYPQRIR